jgi:hypothetical protein
MTQFTRVVDGSTELRASLFNDLQEAIEVLSFDVMRYGATGDGVTDDSTGIQAAIDAAEAAGGGIVYLPTGTYIAENLTLKTTVHLLGAGIEATVVKLKAGSTDPVFSGDDFGSLWNTNSTAGIHSWSIRDLTIDGNKANAAGGGRGIEVYGYGYELNRIVIRDCASDGLHSLWSDDAGAPGPNSMEARLVNVEIHECDDYGIYWGGPHDSVWHGVIVWENGVDGVVVKTNGNSLVATGCHSWGAAQNYAWNIQGSNVHLIGCTAEGAITEQIIVTANDCHIAGGTIFAAGGGATGIHLHTVAGCQIHTHVLNCTSGAIKFTADGGSHLIDILSYQASGAAISGTPSATNEMRVSVKGGGTGSQVRHNGGLIFMGEGDVSIRTGSGAPENNVTAAVGSLYLRTDGGAGTTLYVKESGTGNTGWSDTA